MENIWATHNGQFTTKYFQNCLIWPHWTQVRLPILVNNSTFVVSDHLQVDPSEFEDDGPDLRRRHVRSTSGKSSVPDYSSEFFEDDDDDYDGEDVVQVGDPKLESNGSNKMRSITV